MLRAQPPPGSPAQLELRAVMQRLRVAGGSHDADSDDTALRSSVPCEARVRLRCPGCGASRTRAVTCPRMCPGCPRRRGARASALVSVLPRVPVRHWIYTPPDTVQSAVRDDPALLRWLARCFVQEIFVELGSAEASRRGGAATVVHWATQGVEPRVHVHALALDGAYVVGRKGACFEPAVPCTSDDAALAVARRVGRALRARLEARANKAQRARGGARTPGAVARSGAKPRSAPVVAARCDGSSVRVTPPVAADDRAGVVRLARYITRPWLEPGRFEVDARGHATVALARPRGDGATALEWEADALHRRILAVAPRVHTHPIAFHGVLAPRAALRRSVLPGQLTLWEVEGSRRRSSRERCERCGFALVIEHVEVAVDDLQAG